MYFNTEQSMCQEIKSRLLDLYEGERLFGMAIIKTKNGNCS